MAVSITPLLPSYLQSLTSNLEMPVVPDPILDLSDGTGLDFGNTKLAVFETFAASVSVALPVFGPGIKLVASVVTNTPKADTVPVMAWFWFLRI